MITTLKKIMGACFGKETKQPPKYHPDIRVVRLGPEFEAPSIQVDEDYELALAYQRDVIYLLTRLRTSPYYRRKGEEAALLSDETDRQW